MPEHGLDVLDREFGIVEKNSSRSGLAASLASTNSTGRHVPLMTGLPIMTLGSMLIPLTGSWVLTVTIVYLSFHSAQPLQGVDPSDSSVSKSAKSQLGPWRG